MILKDSIQQGESTGAALETTTHLQRPPTSACENTLPALVDRAAHALMSARDSAEVLEARDMARVAYDAAKSAARIVRAKRAHDEVIAAVYRAQGHALEIEARAKIRLANEYDAAQERGEVAGHGGEYRGNQHSGNVEVSDVATAADIGLRRDEIHEARQLRDAELVDPGIVERTIEARTEAGQEPTKAALREAVDKANGKERIKTKAADPDEIEALRAENEALRAENEDLRDRLREMADQLEEAIEENVSLAKIAETDDKIAMALGEAKKFRDQVRILTERNNGLLNERAAAIKSAQSWQRKAARFEKAANGAANGAAR